jgi:hypothetical protein
VRAEEVEEVEAGSRQQTRLGQQLEVAQEARIGVRWMPSRSR